MTRINDEILESEVFKKLLEQIAGEADRAAFPTARFYAEFGSIDWNLALFLASALDMDGSVQVQEAIMSVCFGALQSTACSPENKTSAVLLLERVGNWPSIRLAIKRRYIDEDYRRLLPLPLRVDSVSAELDHTVRPLAGDTFLGSNFQKQFWKASRSGAWLSVSAPTSTGKSYVVKRWVIDQAVSDGQSAVLYVVPTRALVDEVTKELMEEPELYAVHINSIPWDASLREKGPRILVMTQERVQITLDRFPQLRPTAVFFDEAQKFGDGYRGILLEGVLGEAVRRNPSLRVVFASPMAKNPEALLSRTGQENQGQVFTSLIPNVSQNLYWVNPKPRQAPVWTIERAERGEMRTIADVSLFEEPRPPSKRLAALPVALSAPDALNIIYANTASEAEKCAEEVFSYLGSTAEVQDSRISDLKELIHKSVHPSYLLAQLISRGVAFHYGNMPQPVRQGVEELYRAGLIRFLVCTSTLLEGVNLPCTNIWIMNPRRGRANPMQPADFWNLAGRAGRWGAEFVGNIVCIGTRANRGWTSPPPKQRSSGVICFATETALGDPNRVMNFVRRDGEHPAGSQKDENLEALAAHLFDATSRKENSVALRVVAEESVVDLKSVLESKENELHVPIEIRRSHPGINPQAMQRLLDDLRTKDFETLPLLSPHDAGAFERLERALALCEMNMRAGFGSSRNQRRLAVLLLNWMQGRPVPWLVSERIDREKKHDPEGFKTANCIRSVLADVEQVARFRAPKFLACYADIVNYLAPTTNGQNSGADVTMMLELGVSTPTDVSLMSLGLSRTTTIQISEHITDSTMTTNEVLDWLQKQDLSSLGLPAMTVRETEKVMRRALSRSTRGAS